MNKWDVVILSYPFSDLQAVKARPGIVISPNAFHHSSPDAVFILITSNTTRQAPYDVIVPTTHPEFLRTGLRVASAIRVNKLSTLSKSLVIRKIGLLGVQLQGEVETALKNFFEIPPYQPALHSQ